MLKHSNSILSEIFVDYLRQDKIRKLEVIGTKATVEWVSYRKEPETLEVNLYKPTEKLSILKNENYDSNLQYVDELKYFLKAVENDNNSTNDCQTAIETLRIIESIQNEYKKSQAT